VRRKLVIGIVPLVLLCVLSMACSKGGDPAKMIPEDAAVVVVIPNLGNTTGHIGEFVDWLAQQVPMMAMMKQSMTAAAGVDLTKAESLAEKGLNPKGGAAFAALDIGSKKMVIMIPVKDEDAFVGFINETLKKQGGPEITKEGDNYTFPGGGGVMTITKGFALVSDNADNFSAVTGGGNKLADNENYQLLCKNLGTSNDLLVYVSSNVLATAPIPEAQQMAALAKDIKTIGGALDISSKELTIKIFAGMADMENIKKIMASSGEGSLIESLPGPAPVLAKANLSVPDLWGYIKTKIATDPATKMDLENGMSEMKTATGVDVEANIIANIAGNPSVAYYGMTGRRNKIPDLVITMTVKDEAKIRDSLSKIADAMSGGKKKKGALSEMGVIELSTGPREKMYAAVVKGSLIVTMDDDRMKQILGMLAGTSSDQTALASVSLESAKSALKDDKSTIVYISAYELIKVIREGLSKNKQAQLDAYMAQVGGVANSHVIITVTPQDEGVLKEISIQFGQ